MERPVSGHLDALPRRSMLIGDIPADIDDWIDRWLVVTHDPLTMITLPALWAECKKHVVLPDGHPQRAGRECLLVALVTRGAPVFVDNPVFFQWLAVRREPLEDGGLFGLRQPRGDSTG